MLKRARYIHAPEQGARGNGFSAEIAPVPMVTAPPGLEIPLDKCFFRITFCNSKDQFSRRNAREELSQKEWQEVRVVDVPKLLADAHFLNLTGRSLNKMKDKNTTQYYQNQWAWVYKYFL